MAIKIESASGSITLVPEEGSGDVTATIPRTGIQAPIPSGTYESADTTILKDADIGTSVLAPDGDGSQLTNLPVSSMGGTMTDHIIPDTNAAYDLGNAEKKIRHLFLSNNSLWVGDDHKDSTYGGKKKTKKRKQGKTPKKIVDAMVGAGKLFDTETELKNKFKADIHDPAPDPILDPADPTFHPPIHKWLEFSVMNGQGGFLSPSDIFDDDDDFDSENGIADVEGLQDALDGIDTSSEVDVKIAALVDSAPGTLDTLNELAAALGDDANHVTTMTTLVGTKADQDTTYTKTEVDTADALKANQATTYTKTEVDTADALKANQATTYTKTEVDTADALKADQATTYTKTEVDANIAGIVDSAPGTLDTLNELAAALGDDANHVTTMTTLIGGKVDNAQVLTDVPVSAVFTDTVYTHPTGAGDKHIPSGGASGNILTYSSSGTATWNAPAAGGATSIDGLSDGVVTATGNIGLGANAVNSITTGDWNVGLGDEALTAVTSGEQNVALGYHALKTISTGEANTAIGTNALAVATSNSNIAIGTGAGKNVTTGSGNIVIGKNALYSAVTGGTNISIGNGSMYYNTSGYENVAIGFSALQANTTARGNVAVGTNCMYSNTGTWNSALGFEALKANTTGQSNVALGRGAGDAITTGSNNTIIGDLPGTTALADTVLIGAGTTERLKVDSTGLYVNGTRNLDLLTYTETTISTSGTIDLSLGTVFTHTHTGGMSSFTLSNVPTTGTSGFILILENGGAYPLTWWTGSGGAAIKWPAATPPTLTAAGTDVFTFTTPDSGVTWYGIPSGIGMA